MTMSTAPVMLKNRVRLMCRTRQYRPQHSAAAISSPTAAPASGPDELPAACAVVHRNSAVSRPSRPTARNDVAISTPAPMPSAAVTFCLISPENVRAERRIQNTMAVTNTTATRLSVPPNASCDFPGRFAAVNVRTAPKLIDNPMAAATPVHTWGRRARWSDRTRVATRTETISPASNPSRRPIRKLGNASSHTSGLSPMQQIPGRTAKSGA